MVFFNLEKEAAGLGRPVASATLKIMREANGRKLLAKRNYFWVFDRWLSGAKCLSVTIQTVGSLSSNTQTTRWIPTTKAGHEQPAKQLPNYFPS